MTKEPAVDDDETERSLRDTHSRNGQELAVRQTLSPSACDSIQEAGTN